jgi:hypothetical protein
MVLLLLLPASHLLLLLLCAGLGPDACQLLQQLHRDLHLGGHFCFGAAARDLDLGGWVVTGG